MPRRFRFPVKRSPKSDPQQYRMYRMENEAIGARMYAKLTRGTVGVLVRSVCRSYGVPTPRLVWKDLGAWAAQWVQIPGERRSTIELNTRKSTSKDIITITHELAHNLHFWLSGSTNEGHEAHGPEFMACHMSILDTCRMIPVAAMKVICDEWDVKYLDPGKEQSGQRLQKLITRKR